MFLIRIKYITQLKNSSVYFMQQKYVQIWTEAPIYFLTLSRFQSSFIWMQIWCNVDGWFFVVGSAQVYAFFLFFSLSPYTCSSCFCWIQLLVRARMCPTCASMSLYSCTIRHAESVKLFYKCIINATCWFCPTYVWLQHSTTQRHWQTCHWSTWWSLN